jgi:hypothetical protein
LFDKIKMYGNNGLAVCAVSTEMRQLSWSSWMRPLKYLFVVTFNWLDTNQLLDIFYSRQENFRPEFINTTRLCYGLVATLLRCPSKVLGSFAMYVGIRTWKCLHSESEPGWPDWANLRLPIRWLFTLGSFFFNDRSSTNCV